MRFDDLEAKWLERAQRIQSAHYEAATILERMHIWLGIPAVSLATIVGSSAFATLDKDTHMIAKGAVAMASIVTAILAGMQTVCRHGERAAKHQLAGVKYGALKRELELFGVFPSTDEEKRCFVREIQGRWDKLNEESPSIPKSVWDKRKK